MGIVPGQQPALFNKACRGPYPRTHRTGREGPARP